MATGMVTFKQDRVAGTYPARPHFGTDKMDGRDKFLFDIVIASDATAGVPIAATLTPPAGAPGDMLESADEFDFSLLEPDRKLFKRYLGGSVVVD